VDSKEAKAYVTTARVQLEDAELAFRERRFSLCALLSASSAENAVSGLLVELNAKPSRMHKNSLVLHRLSEQAGPERRANFLELIDHMKLLEPHLTKARYPILRGEDLVPPSGLYTEQIAEELLTKARTVYKKVKDMLG